MATNKRPGPRVVIDQIVRSRRKTVALVITREGKLVVRAPLRASLELINEFVQQKAGWITEKQAQALSRQEQAAGRRFVPGETFLYLGHPYPLVVEQRGRPLLTLLSADGATLYFSLAESAQPRAREAFTAWYRAQALRVLQDRVEHFSALTGLKPSGLRITSARTRWGSCSARGTLSFPWRLVMAPRAAIDYVVVHELVHLREKNHARAFWDAVARILPDYKTQVAWFKINGHRLSL